MLKLISLNPSGFFSYGLHPTIPLNSQGLVLLGGLNKDRQGSANGAGKTSIMNTICHLLFGQNPSGESGDAIANRTLKKYFGRLVFLDNQNTKWRIIETRKWRKTDKYPEEKLDPTYVEEPSEIHTQNLRYSGTDVYLERWDGTTWIDERNTNTKAGVFRLDLKATRKRIVEIIDLNYDQFMSIGYLAPKQSLKFINGTHKERLEVLSDLINLSSWDKRVAKIREYVSEIESKKDSVESELIGLRRASGSITEPDRSILTILETKSKECDNQITACDQELKNLDLNIVEWRNNCTNLDTLIKNTYLDIRTKTALRSEIQRSLDSLVLAYTEKCQIIRNRPSNIAITQLETDISEKRGRIAARKFDLEQLLSGAGKCPRCRTNVTFEHLARQRELIQLEIKDLEGQILLQNEKLATLIDEWRIGIQHDLDLAQKEYQIGRQLVEQQLRELDISINDANLLIESYQEQKLRLGDDPTRRIDAVAQKRLLFLSEKTRADEKCRQWHEQKRRCDEYQVYIITAEQQLSQHQEDIRYHQTLEKLFGDKGLKSWKLNNLLDELNSILKEYINIITDGNKINLKVTQYREKSDGKTTADIQILVQEGIKTDVPLPLYSDGERQQIMLAFIGAFWQLASRHGSGINTLFLDEVLGPLDEINAQRVFNFIEHLRMQGRSTVFITTHNRDIKDQIQFDQIWTAVKENHMSNLVQDEC